MSRMYIPQEKKQKNVVTIQADVTHLPSLTHKYGALKNKSRVFDDRRKRKPKYKVDYMEG